MPKQRQRIVFCDCLDCAVDDAQLQRPTDVSTALSPAGEAAARQDPPPKSLIILLTGALQPVTASSGAAGLDSIGGGGRDAAVGRLEAGGAPGLAPAPRPGATALDALRLPHLDRAARAGCQSLLAVREGSAAAPGEWR
jgi:hypothetical protein